MTMSFTATFDAAAVTRPETSSKPGFFARLIEARTARAARAVRSHFARFSDAELARLGYGPREIADIRAAGAQPQPVLL